MPGRTYNPGEIAVRGEAIYRERIQQQVVTAKQGSFVVIDVETGDYEIDAGDPAATQRLLERRPYAVTYAIRVGHLAAYCHVGGFRVSGTDDRGDVTGDPQALGTIEVNNAEGHPRPMEVVLDTGFIGYLTLQAETIRELGLSSVGQRTFELPNGSCSSFEAYLAEVSWHGHPTNVVVFESNNTPMLGMALLWGSRVALEAVTQREVLIGALNSVPSMETTPIKTGFLGHLWSMVKSSLVVLLATFAGTVAIVALAYGVDSLPLNFGDIITFMGIWLAIGVLFGQNKLPTMSLSSYIEGRLIGVVCCYALFFVIAIAYVVRGEGGSEAVEGSELFGLLVLSLVGFAIGFFAGQDREPKR
ncbi:MAG: hypothetical protein F4X66_02120 [Chloroflexi bacterium]|nr:hypothetical protein [Chloroflexota bacterium]MYE41306.1 hypothetical protein [Chloroflexota bacterium]